MREVRKELKSLRYEIQTMKGLLNALDRQLTRVHGREVVYSAPDPEIDEARLRADCGLDESDLGNPNMLRFLRDQQAARIQIKRDRAAYLRHKLDTQLPITPWGVVIALIKVWSRQIRT